MTTTTITTRSFFDAFNARALEPEEVAQSFIRPACFDDVLKRAHSLIVGPRGSGKTTILKMLQPAALEAWRDPVARHYREVIDFTGVFVPADRSWSEQIDALGEGKLDKEHKKLLAVSAFTTHVLRALVDAMQYRVHPPETKGLIPYKRIRLTRSDEADLVTVIAQQWFVAPRIPSLQALKQSLTSRLSSIWELSSKESLRDPSDRAERLADINYLHLNFLACGSAAIEAFDDLVSERTGKWALLFDELELAPKRIRQELLESLRSGNSKLLFKLSMSPYSEDADLLHHALSATFGNDYNQIALWYAHKEAGYPFCNALFKAMLKDKGIAPRTPAQIFGVSEFETLREEYGPSGSAYESDTRLQRQFSRAARNDPSFRKFLNKRAIDLEKLDSLTEDERAATIRKVRALIAVREAYRRIPSESPVGKKQLRRSRKNPRLYSGAQSLFAIVEGNPRWFIGIVGRLIEEYAKHQHKVKASKQSTEIGNAVDRFRAFLRTIPCPPLRGNQPPRGVLSMLDLIGRYFYGVVVRGDFNPDAPLTFQVDSRSEDQLLESLGRALNAGAIIYVNDRDSDLVLNTLRGKRFRLSYLLAPYYGLPLALGRAQSLKVIMNEDADVAKQNEHQDSLFQR